MNKKAEMGVGTLIIFIAMLLVAAVAAGVLIQTVGSLQEKSLSTGQQAKTQISTNAEVVEVSATDGRDTILNDFNEIIKLSPGSDPIKLNQVIFTFNTKDKTATLKYRGTSGLCVENHSSGYWTRNTETVSTELSNGECYNLTEDMDYDGTYTDMVCFYSTAADGSRLTFNYSSGTRNFSITNITGASSSNEITLNYQNEYVDEDNITFGKLTLNGTVTSNAIPVGYLKITPYKEGEGFFAVEYLQEGTNHIDGNLQRGDLIKLCFKAPQDIREDMMVRLNFIPKIGTPTMTEFVTPDVMSTERVYLYP